MNENSNSFKREKYGKFIVGSLIAFGLVTLLKGDLQDDLDLILRIGTAIAGGMGYAGLRVSKSRGFYFN